MSQAYEKTEAIERSDAPTTIEQEIIQKMGERLDALWWLDQHLASGGWTPQLEAVWRRLKDEERKAVEELKYLIVSRIHAPCGLA